MKDIVKKMSVVKTKTELDSMRLEVADAMQGPEENFTLIQTAFRKAKNRLKRIPLKERTW